MELNFKKLYTYGLACGLWGYFVGRVVYPKLVNRGK